MKSLDYYLSIPANPWTEDNWNSQDDINERAQVQFKYDSIFETIGTEECGRNIDLFYNELMLELDETQKSNLYRSCLQRMIDIYDLDYLLDNQEDPFPNFPVETELKKMLMFFEQNKWREYLVKYLPVEDPEIVFDEQRFRDYLILNLRTFVKRLLDDDQEALPYLLKKWFHLASREDMIGTLMYLILKDKNAVVTDYYLKNEGLSDV